MTHAAPHLPTFIGFAGHAGAGKDTAADTLVQRLGFTNFKFAGPLKAMTAELLRCQGITEARIQDMIEGDAKETASALLGGRSPRHAMQTLGAEWGRRQMGTDFWVDIALNRAMRADRVVFSDVRYENEVAAIRRHGGVVVKIVRPGLEVDMSHSSEQYVAAMVPDMTLTNDFAGAVQFQEIVYTWTSAYLRRVKPRLTCL